MATRLVCTKLKRMQEGEDAMYAESGGIVHNKQWRRIFPWRELVWGGGRLFAVDVGAGQTAEEGKLESIKSLG